MVRLFVRLLILVIIALGAVLLVRDDPGFVLLRYRDYSVETSLAFALVALIVLVIAVYYAVRFLRGLWRLPGAMQRQSQNRRFSKSRRQLNQGLIDLAEGRFEQAENHLMRLVDFSESPLVHYLAAARAAQLQGKHDARDSYLKAAHEANPGAELAIGVTQAELQLAHQQTEQALATLTHLHSVAPRHDYVTMLLARAYLELEDWQALVKILPDVRRKKLLKESRLREMEIAGYCGVLERATSDQQSFDKTWSKVPKVLRSDAMMMRFYIDTMARKRWHNSNAEQLLLKSLDNKWDNGLIEAYGRFEARDANAQLARVEKWIDDFGHNESLLLALGRISMRARLWGKAQGYLEASIGAKATPAACLALAELFEQQLQQPDKAAEYYQQGLKLSIEAGA
ncbi:MAG: tetratricopeptide repeat protein [Gammaproteobacteria bacterium]|nr:tetratricopeptide repeat protein [Gammaproteobacteria bacterium]MCP4388459.1 tetratricopeptide repeat protein [Gammaproteobacteria bacterium]MCP4980685.1 tetratricopeptide repeat protein [Gammaproteobacteria bacterium]